MEINKEKNLKQETNSNSVPKKKRKAKNDTSQERIHACPCGKSYLSYPALYLHQKLKHNGKPPSKLQSMEIQKPILNKQQLVNSDNSNSFTEILKFFSSFNLNLVREKSENEIWNKEIYQNYLDNFPIDWFQQNTDYNQFLSILQNKFAELEVSDEIKLNELSLESSLDNNQIKEMKCDQIFSHYLINIAKYLTPVGFSEMAFFVSLLRLVLNKIGWEKIRQKDCTNEEEIIKSIQQNQEFCEKQNAEYLLEVANELIIEFIPKYTEASENCRSQLFGGSDEKINHGALVIQYLSNWLFEKDFLNSQLQLIIQ